MHATMEELTSIEDYYVALGISGARRSIDVVHSPLGVFPHGLLKICTGKEAYPTLGYNIICDRT